MLAAALEALSIILDPARIGWILLGVSTGLVVGILPGLGGIVGMSILLPFIFGMDPFDGIALLIGMAAVVTTADTFPSVLLGTPGSAGSQATIVDGYPLARKGQARRALGAAFSASMFGGILGAVVLFGLLSVARPIVLALGSPHLFMLGVLGLCTVGTLVRGSALAGVLAAFMGLGLGMIGSAPAHPTYRFVFDSLYLWDGIPIGVVALALFAVPEVVDLLARGESISKRMEVKGGLVRGLRDTVRNYFLVARSAILGTGVGMIPGLGASVVDWLAYSFSQSTLRNTENFGKGDIRGVIAPESANNAKEAGALIPTLLFSVPGSAITAMLMGGLLLMGVQAGPSMVAENLPLTLTIVWTLGIANVFGTLACLLFVVPMSKLTTIRASRLVPFLIVIITIAAYQSSNHWGDVLFLILLGTVGWIMKNVGWARAPMLIGFVLAPNIERYLQISVGRYGTEWLADPLVLVLAFLCVAMIAGSVRRTTRKDTTTVEATR